MNELEALSISDLYLSEDAQNHAVQIGGWIEEEEIPSTFQHIERFEISDTDEIDWDKQWKSFSPSFYDGLSHIDLSSYIGGKSCELILKPGGGFGDLSHPTTRLCLSLMASHVNGATVIDIGCGSGILSLAALHMGATRAIGIDIDETALVHARANAELNQLEDRSLFVKETTLLKNLKGPLVFVMNMIFSEQQVAWLSQPQLHPLPALIITSGILSSQQEGFLALAKQWGWNLIEEKQEGEWSGFVFRQ